MKNKKIKKYFKNPFIKYILHIIINIYLLTIRIKYENENELIDHMEKGKSAILCASHQHFFICFKGFKRYLKYDIAGIVSKSKDGDLMTDVGKLNGYKAIRGSSSKGGKHAMESMIKYLKNKNTIGAIAPDGPKGPLGIVKPGAIRIAQKSGAAIFPSSAIACSAWHVHSWDKSQIPKPFSKVTIKFGKKIYMNSTSSNNEFEKKRIELQNSLNKYLKIR